MSTSEADPTILPGIIRLEEAAKPGGFDPEAMNAPNEAASEKLSPEKEKEKEKSLHKSTAGGTSLEQVPPVCRMRACVSV